MVDIRMTKARSSLIMSQPFFGTLALHLELVEDETVETMATDGSKLIYAPSFLDSISPDELKGVIVHNVLHCAYRHPGRRKNRDFELWNDACDYVINMDVLTAGFKLPTDRLLDERFKGMSAEEIYKRLRDSQLPPPTASGRSPSLAPNPANGPKTAPGKGPSNGQGLGLGPKPGTALAGSPTMDAGGPLGSPAKGPSPWARALDAVPSYKAADVQAIDNAWKVRVLQALAIAGTQAGNLAGSLERLAEDVKKPTIDWREELQRFIDNTIHTDFTWTNPNKRYLHQGLIFPGVQKDGVNKLGIAIDTSGSVDQRLFNQFRAEVQDILDNGKVQEIIVLYCDTKVRGQVQSFTNGDIVEMKTTGGGGTLFSPAIEWFLENEADLSAMIYFTDLQCNDFGPEPHFPVLWAAYGYESFLKTKTVPFGEIVKLLEN